MELWPSWSRDGKSLVFVRWTDAGLGEIHVTGAGGGASRKVTGTPGHYAEPRLSPDGKTIVFERRGGGGLTSARWGEDPGVYRIAAAGGKAERIDSDGSKPQHRPTDKPQVMVTARGGQHQHAQTG